MKNLDIKYLLKRIFSYIIDIFLLIIIISTITSIKSLNKNYKEYTKIEKEFTSIQKEYQEIITKINTFNNKKVTTEDYNEFIKIERYKEYFIEKYDDSIIENRELRPIKDNINKKYQSIALEYEYQLQKISIPNSILTLSIILLYFTIIPFIFKGKTLGKLIFKLRLVSINDKKLNILSYLLRSIILNNIIFNTTNILFLALSSKSTYYKANDIITLLSSIVEALVIFFVFAREDHRGLHDIILSTQVIEDIKSTEEEQPKEEEKNSQK